MLKNAERVESLRRNIPESVQFPLKRMIRGYRCLTSGLRLLPDYLIIGARRCGTTSLYNYLIQHPCVLPALTKEVAYFDNWFGMGSGWYRSHFPLRAQKQWSQLAGGQPIVTGEATPSYLLDPLVPDRVHGLMPEVKLIVLLRNPVDTIHSAYHLGLKHGTYTAMDLVFEECIADELAGCVNPGVCANGERIQPFLPQGVFVDGLKRWLEVFPAEQIKVLIYEDLFREPDMGYNEVLNFLGLPAHHLPTYKVYNHATYSPLDVATRSRLVEYYAPHNQRLRELLGKPIGWDC